MLHMKPSIEDGHLVLRFDGEIDPQSAATVAEMIDHSMGDCSLDFTAAAFEDASLGILDEAVRRCPYKLSVRGLPKS